jgi:hypothetical protein
MTKSISTTPSINDILKAVGNSTVLKDLLAQVDAAAAIEKKGNNVELRKAAHRKNLAQNNKIELAKVGDALKTMLPLGKKIAKKSDQIMDEGVTDEDAVEMMESYLAGKLVSEAQTAIQEMVKTLVFRAMDLSAAEQGEEFPEQTNMVLDVPELNKRFCREGVGRKEPELDQEKLIATIGEDLWNQISVAGPREISESKLAAAVVDNPELLEQVRSAVKPGDWKSPRLMVRDIPANEQE